jgi:hypothetical protein
LQDGVEQFCSKDERPGHRLPPGDENLCNDFNADAQLKRTVAQYDITG